MRTNQGQTVSKQDESDTACAPLLHGQRFQREDSLAVWAQSQAAFHSILEGLADQVALCTNTPSLLPCESGSHRSDPSLFVPLFLPVIFFLVSGLLDQVSHPGKREANPLPFN
jgi:hypothetical protein